MFLYVCWQVKDNYQRTLQHNKEPRADLTPNRLGGTQFLCLVNTIVGNGDPAVKSLYFSQPGFWGRW